MVCPHQTHLSKTRIDCALCHNPADVTLQGYWTKWYKSWGLKTVPFAVLIVLTSLLIGITILEHRTQVMAHFKMSSFLNFSDSQNMVKVYSAEPPTSPCQENAKHFVRSEALPFPKGIQQETSDLHFRSFSSDPIAENKYLPTSQSLLAMPVGIKQKETVDKIIQKFPLKNFTVMLFHYDGVIDAWNVFPWSKRVIHVVALGQTKWWYVKRFLHPDIVADYKYIFIWDEDIGVEHFLADRYIHIVEKEGLEISQPALDRKLSEVHHQITARISRGKVHRRYYKFRGSGLCFSNSTGPPCTGWVEMMVPVFSQAAWRCTWYMIQNDLVHAWGLDMKLGYCAQGERSLKVGIVDEQYVVHYGIPSLGGLINQTSSENDKGTSRTALKTKPTRSEMERIGVIGRFFWEIVHIALGTACQVLAVFLCLANGELGVLQVRRRSSVELEIFRKRWIQAAKEDQCWVDPYQSTMIIL